MDPELVKKALEALEQGDDAAAMEILKGMIVSAAGGEPGEEGDEPGAEGDGAEGVATPEAESAIDPKVVPASETAPEDEEEEDDPKKKMARRALSTMLCRLTGTSNFAAALVRVDEYRTSHITLASERAKIDADRGLLEADERRKLCADLVKMGAEFPSTIFADAASKKPSKLKARWAQMSIATLRTHVEDQRAARGPKKPVATPRPGDVRPPVGADDGETHGLTLMQLSICKDAGITPAEFASLAAFRDQTDETYLTDLRARTAAAHTTVSLAMAGKKA